MFVIAYLYEIGIFPILKLPAFGMVTFQNWKNLLFCKIAQNVFLFKTVMEKIPFFKIKHGFPSFETKQILGQKEISIFLGLSVFCGLF